VTRGNLAFQLQEMAERDSFEIFSRLIGSSKQLAQSHRKFSKLRLWCHENDDNVFANDWVFFWIPDGSNKC